MRFAILLTQTYGMPPVEEFWLVGGGLWSVEFAKAKKFATREDAEAALIGEKMIRGEPDSDAGPTEEIWIMEVP